MYFISFGDLNIMHQIFVLIGIFTVYICMYVILVSMCVCVRVRILLYKNVCLYAFVYMRTVGTIVLPWTPFTNMSKLLHKQFDGCPSDSLKNRSKLITSIHREIAI